MIASEGTGGVEWADRCCPAFLRQPLTADDLSELSARLAALGHPVRLGLLSALSHSAGMTTAELAAHLGRSQATVSHHTTLLADHGLISADRGWRSARWRVEHEPFDLLRQALCW